MKRLGIALAAVAALIVAGHSPAARAADQPVKLPPITQKQRDQAKAEVPAVLTDAKITCTPTDAYVVQSGVDEKTKVKTTLYEVSCQEGLGYILQSVSATKDTPAKSAGFNCLVIDAQATGKNAVTCRLDANLDPKQGIAKLAVAAGKTCPTATAARWIGGTAAGDNYYEVACAPGVGYVIQSSVGKAPTGNTCVEMLGSGSTECTLTTKDQILAGLQPLAAKSGTPCTVSNVRVVGTDKASGSTFYEFACGATPGFIVQASASNEFQNAIPCGKAQNIGGGCSLTVVDETAENATYTKLATSASFPCDVSKYRYLGKETKSNSEIVELACKNRPDGGIGVFPIGAGKGQVLDCLQGGAYGVTCQLTQPTVLYSAYTDRLVKQGKTQCKVSGAKFLASTTDGSDLIETACSDGLPGFVISVDHTTGATKELLTCGQATRMGASCSLPTNVAKK